MWKGDDVFFWRRRRHPIGDEDLGAYLDGQLGEADRARLEAHIESCAACREELAELRALQRSLRELPEARAPRSFALREADVRPDASPRALGTLERAPALLGGLATVAFLAFGSLVAVDLAGQEAGDEGGMAVSGFEDRGDGQIVPEAPDDSGERTLDEAEKMAGEDGEAEEGRERVPAGPPALREPTPECALTGACAGDGSSLGQPGPQATPQCAPNADCRSGAWYAVAPSPSPTITPAPTPAPRAEPEQEEDSRIPLRAAEAATAALALLTTGSLTLVLRRRRS